MDLPRLSEVAALAAALRGNVAPPAQSFVRLVRCVALSGGSTRMAATLAEQYGDRRVSEIMKAGVGAGTLTDSDWAPPIAGFRQLAAEFIEAARPTSILLNLTGARRVPLAVSLVRVTTGAVAGWVAEGAPKPVSEMSLAAASLAPRKAAVIVAFSEELLKMALPGAEAAIRGELIAAVNTLIDATLVGSAAATAAQPAGLLAGITPVASSGSTPAAIAADLAAVAAGMHAAGSRLRAPVLLLPPELSLSIGLQTGVAGPTLPRSIVSAAVPADQVVLVDQSELLIGDDGEVAVTSSNEATLMLDGAPVAGTTQLTSLWQHNLVAIRVERFVNWSAPVPAAAAGYIDGIEAPEVSV